MKRYLGILLCLIMISFAVVVLSSCNDVQDDNNATVDQATEKKLPWEDGGKQPEEYTYEEFEALSAVEQEAFVESFESSDAFGEWEKNSGYVDTDTSTQAECPWEDGGKQPEEYTFEEFEALSGPQQELFIDSFGTVEAFKAWESKALQNNQ